MTSGNKSDGTRSLDGETLSRHPESNSQIGNTLRPPCVHSPCSSTPATPKLPLAKSLADLALPDTSFLKAVLPQLIYRHRETLDQKGRAMDGLARYSQSRRVFWIASLLVMTNGPSWTMGCFKGSPAI